MRIRRRAPASALSSSSLGDYESPKNALSVNQAEMNHHRISHFTAYSNARLRLARSALRRPSIYFRLPSCIA
jgi:hypothetical protein